MVGPRLLHRDTGREEARVVLPPQGVRGRAVREGHGSVEVAHDPAGVHRADPPFGEQEKQFKTGDKPAAARELVKFLVLYFLTTGEKLEMCRWRCSDVMESKRRVIVGPFGDFGLEIANVSDLWKSPVIALGRLHASEGLV